MSSSILEDRIKQWTRSYTVLAGTNTPEDSARFVELFNSIYARKINMVYYDWRFFNRAVNSELLLTFNKGNLIGTCGFNLREINSSVFCHGALIVDLMVDANYRGTGLVFSQLNREVERAAIKAGAKCLYTLPNKKGADAWLATEGWVRVNQLITCECETRQLPLNINFNIEIKEVPYFDHWVDTISVAFSRNHPSLKFANRDARFLNWRFISNPVYKYSIHVLYLNGEIFGYFVLKVFHDPITGNAFGDIVDILWSDDNSKALKYMLEFSLAYFYKLGIKQTALWLQTNTILDNIGHDIGFNNTEQKRDFCIKPLDQNSIWLKDPKNWFITLTDSEIY